MARDRGRGDGLSDSVSEWVSEAEETQSGVATGTELTPEPAEAREAAMILEVELRVRLSCLLRARACEDLQIPLLGSVIENTPNICVSANRGIAAKDSHVGNQHNYQQSFHDNYTPATHAPDSCQTPWRARGRGLWLCHVRP